MTTISKWTTVRGTTVEMHTEHVTEIPWFTDDWGIEHTKKVDEIRINKVILNGRVFDRSHHYGRKTIDGQRFLDLGEEYIDGKRVKMIVALPAEVEVAVWGEWENRQNEKRKAEENRAKEDREKLKKMIANGYCTKCGSYCYGDCNEN